jgi:hypothetical protein
MHLLILAKVFFMLFVILGESLIRNLQLCSERFRRDDHVPHPHLLGLTEEVLVLLIVGHHIGFRNFHVGRKLVGLHT